MSASLILFLRFSIKYRGGWLLYLGYGGVTVAADYRGRETMQISWLLITVPCKLWWPITTETCRANAVISDCCTDNTVAAYYRGSVPCKCRDREKPCHDLPYQNFMPRTALYNEIISVGLCWYIVRPKWLFFHCRTLFTTVSCLDGPWWQCFAVGRKSISTRFLATRLLSRGIKPKPCTALLLATTKVASVLEYGWCASASPFSPAHANVGHPVSCLSVVPFSQFTLGTPLFDSFNMLAQSMASSKMFTYVPKGQLRRNVRWPRVRQPV